MTIVFAIGLFVELLFIIRLEYKVCANESGIFGIDGRIDRLAHDIKGNEEAIKVLSDSVRKLNGVVKDLEQKQPKIEPKNRMNTRAFIAGWDADETEPEDPAKKHIVDIMLNGTYEQKQDLIEECTEDFNDGVLFVLDYFVKNAPTVIPREDGEKHDD